MCEYCGCQDVAVIAELTAEHDELRALGRDLEVAIRAGDLARAGQLARRMHAVLTPHTRVEEDGLFPAMAGEFADHIQGLIAEHRSVERVLAELADGTADADWPARTKAALDDLFEHILKEQDGVFPAALSILSVHDWEAMADVRRSAGSGLTASR